MYLDHFNYGYYFYHNPQRIKNYDLKNDICAVYYKTCCNHQDEKMHIEDY